MSHAAYILTYMNESCRMYGWAMSWLKGAQFWRCVADHTKCAPRSVNEKYHICHWVMPHVWIRHELTKRCIIQRCVAKHKQCAYRYMNESCHIHQWVIPHVWTRNNLTKRWTIPKVRSESVKIRAYIYEWVIFINELFHMCERAISWLKGGLCQRRVASQTKYAPRYTNESCRMCTWVSWHVCKWVMSRL